MKTQANYPKGNFPKKAYSPSGATKMSENRSGDIHMIKQTLLGAAAAVAIALSGFAADAPQRTDTAKIDRQALVTRHNVTLTEENHDPKQWLQVGNGEIAFGIGIDGLQTFAGLTMSHWGWHTEPLPEGLTPGDFKLNEYQVDGRTVRYKSGWLRDDPLWNWLRQNPHRMNLANLGLLRDNQRVHNWQLSDVRQTMDLWSGVITSRYMLDGQPVTVETCAHPDRDILAVRFSSPLVEANRLSVKISFPYGSGDGSGGTFNKPEAHATTVTFPGGNAAVFNRRLDHDEYEAVLAWNGGAAVKEQAPHTFVLQPQDGVLEFVFALSPTVVSKPLPDFAEVKAASMKHWPEFWNRGGAVDLSESKDQRWKELERRIVLSQYLTAVNGAGSHPPQEAGLFNNGWNGKFHLEMHWWHGTHYALWDRWEMFERSLGWYRAVLPVARQRAAFNGFQGARWPKMTGPEGRESPGMANVTTIWQQPHTIFYAELDYRLHPTPATLEKWREVVFATADFLASFPVWNPDADHYQFAQPWHDMAELNGSPAFELGYWRYGLRVAQQWRERLGMPRVEKWDDVLKRLAPVPHRDGMVWFGRCTPEHEPIGEWQNKSHPAHLGVFGMLPGDGVDPAMVAPAVKPVLENWQWDTAWGWDYPMTAMCAARTGQPSLAIDALLHPSAKNHYTVVGNNTGGGSAYYPANGGLLYAIAMMAAGWDGGPDKHAPGFPDDGSWVVKWEGLKKAQ